MSMNYMSEPKLMPCAHCGSTNVHLKRQCLADDDNVDLAWNVICYECGVQTQSFVEDTPFEDLSDYAKAHMGIDNAIDCAVNVWNTRV